MAALGVILQKAGDAYGQNLKVDVYSLFAASENLQRDCQIHSCLTPPTSS